MSADAIPEEVASPMKPNAVALRQLRAEPMPALLAFRARCVLAIDWLKRAQQMPTLKPQQKQCIETLQSAFERAIHGIDTGKYREQHIPRLRASAVRAIRNTTIELFRPQLLPGLIPSALEYAEGARVLLVGERPGDTELRTGIPFCDREALRRSRCGSCPDPFPCYPRWRNEPSPTPTRSHCQYPSRKEDHPPNEEFQRLLEEQTPHHASNTGDLLRPMLLDSGLYRSVWEPQPFYESLQPVCVTNVFRVGKGSEVDEPDIRWENGASAKSATASEKRLQHAPLWLLAIEALVVQPRVTVLLGYIASLAAYQITETRSGLFHSAVVKPAPPFGYVITTFHPVHLLREEDELKRQIMEQSIRNALTKAAHIAADETYWPFVNPDDVFTLSQYQDSLAFYRRHPDQIER